MIINKKGKNFKIVGLNVKYLIKTKDFLRKDDFLSFLNFVAPLH